MRAGLETPFPGGAAQAVVAVERRGGRDRIGRMNVDRRAQRLRALPEWIERRVIEILAVGVAVDHRAAEFEVAHAAFEFGGGGGRVLHGEVSETGIAIRLFLDFARQKVVRTLAPCGAPSRCRARFARRGRQSPVPLARCRRGPWFRCACRRSRSASPAGRRGFSGRRRRSWSANNLRIRVTKNALRARFS